jgi:DNA-binding NarL/FixJ family response regulator
MYIRLLVPIITGNFSIQNTMKESLGTIVIVDDDDTFRDLLYEWLSMRGYDVETAESAEEALELFMNHTIDLYLVDIKLKGMDGLTFLKMLDLENCVSAAIVITGENDFRYGKEAMQSGAYSYITKPIDFRDFKIQVEKAIELVKLKRIKENYTIRIIVADDHTIIRKGVKQIVEEVPEMCVVAEASTGAETLNLVHTIECDLLILDISMPDMNGINVMRHLRAENNKLPVLILSMYPEAQYAVRLFRAGISGYLTKDKTPEELVNAIHVVTQGKRYVTPMLAGAFLTDLQE